MPFLALLCCYVLYFQGVALIVRHDQFLAVPPDSSLYRTVHRQIYRQFFSIVNGDTDEVEMQNDQYENLIKDI